MTQKHARRQLEKMLLTFSAGTILHLLGDIVRDDSEQARQANNEVVYQQCKTVEHALFVVGIGIDGTIPR